MTLFTLLIHIFIVAKQWRIQDFPLGGPTRWGAPISGAYTFWQKHMRKRKKLILLGGGGGGGGAPAGGASSIRQCKAFAVSLHRPHSVLDL